MLLSFKLPDFIKIVQLVFESSCHQTNNQQTEKQISRRMKVKTYTRFLRRNNLVLRFRSRLLGNG